MITLQLPVLPAMLLGFLWFRVWGLGVQGSEFSAERPPHLRFRLIGPEDSPLDETEV